MNDTELTTWRLRLGLPASPPARHGPPKGDLSANKVRLLDRCKQAYAFAKIDKLDSRPTDAKIRGSVVHHALELVARPRLGAPNPVVGEPELRAAFEKASALYKASTAAQSVAWTTLKPLVGQLDFSRTFSVEENWKLAFDSDADGGAAFTAVGAFDRLDARDDVVEIHDYKSGADVKSVAELRDDPQVLLYAAYVRSHWSGPFMLVFHYLAAGISVPVRGDDLGERGLSLARAKMAEIRAMETWPATTGPHCVFCDFRRDCPAYGALARTKQEEAVTYQPPLTASDDELLRERQRCSTLARMFEDHRKTCDEALRARLDVHGKVFGGGLRAKLVTRVSRKLPDDQERLAETLANCGKYQDGEVVDGIRRRITSVNEKKVEAFVKDMDDSEQKLAEQALDELREPRDIASYVDVRPITGGF